MKERFVRVVRKSGTSLALNIPAEIVALLDIKEGELVHVVIEKVKKHGTQ